ARTRGLLRLLLLLLLLLSLLLRLLALLGLLLRRLLLGGGFGLRLRRLLGLATRALLFLAAAALLFLAAAPLFLLGAALRLSLAPGGGGLLDGLADRGDHQRARADRVVVAGHREIDRHRIDVGVDEPDDRDPQALGLRDRDRLGLQVHDEDGVRQALHVAHAAEVVLELLELSLARHALLR